MSDLMEGMEVLKPDDLLAVLDSSAVGEEEPEIEPAIPPVTDLLQGEAAVARIVIGKNAIIRYKQVASLIAARAKALIEAEEVKMAQAKQALQPFVKKIVSKNLSLDPKSKKSINFMSGKAGYKGSGGSMDILDMDKVAQYCDEKDFGVVVVKKTVTKTDLKVLMKANPEEFAKIKNVKFNKGVDNFYVT